MKQWSSLGTLESQASLSSDSGIICFQRWLNSLGLIPLGKKPDNVSQAGSFAICIQSFQFEVDNCLSGTPGKVSGTIVLLFSRIKNVLIYGRNVDNGIKFI